MQIKVEAFDLEGIEDIALANLFNDLEAINNTDGYSRADLESIENRLTGAFTDVEDFDFREIPTGNSTVNSNIVCRRISELKKIIGTGINNRYNKYLVVYGNLIHELSNIVELLNRHKEHTPSPILTSLESAYLYDGDYDSVKLSGTVFSKNHVFYSKLRTLRDETANLKINNFNYLVDNVLDCSDDLIENRKEFRYSILRKVLNTNDITYDNAISLFSNSNDVLTLVENTNKELLHTLGNIKDIINWDAGSDGINNRWISSVSDLAKYTAMAEDKHSLALLKLLALFRYFDEYSELKR